MAETVIEKEACAKCGAEVREGTVFCYACGGRVAPAIEEQSSSDANETDPNTQAALDDLARKLSDDDAAIQKPVNDDKIAQAAAERKKARKATKREREFVWEPRSDLPVGLLIAVAVVALAAVLAVLITIVWK